MSMKLSLKIEILVKIWTNLVTKLKIRKLIIFKKEFSILNKNKIMNLWLLSLGWELLRLQAILFNPKANPQKLQI